MTFGDAWVVLGVVVALLLFLLDRAWTERREIKSACNALIAIRDAIKPWGDRYFAKGYSDEEAWVRAQEDHKYISAGSYGEIFRVPTEPVAALFTHPALGGLIRPKTVEAVGVALWRMSTFNQLVQQKSTFNAQHLVDYVSDGPEANQRREVLGTAARVQSAMLHGSAISDGQWYADLMREVNSNIQRLTEAQSGKWWARRWVLAFSPLVAAAVVAVAWTGIDQLTGDSPDRHSRPVSGNWRGHDYGVQPPSYRGRKCVRCG
jgi:hypothetical protein